MLVQDVPFFAVPLFGQKINFRVVNFRKSQVDINSGLSFLKKLLFRVLILIKLHIPG